MPRNLSSKAVVCAALALLSGCASPPQLEPKSAAAPPGVDFSGDWLVRPAGNAGGRPGSSPDADRSIEELTRRSTRRRSSRRSSGPAVHVFLETGRALKITQTDFGFFISIDRSVVEELKFGENRRVSVGPIEAQRVSGWQGAAYVVETLDEEGAILREEWYLDNGGAMLRRDVSISYRGKQQFSFQQVYDRQ